jgi:hypothetical protein
MRVGGLLDLLGDYLEGSGKLELVVGDKEDFTVGTFA